MQRRPTVFFDFDDTLSDPIPFFLQFTRECGGLFNARFGGETEAWEKAITEMLVAIEMDYIQRFIGYPTNGYREWLRDLRTTALRQPFEALQIPLPAEVPLLYSEIQFTALSRCNAAFPGAQVALQTLSEQGYPLHMASGQESAYLRGSLTGMGLHSYFDRLFGPDLIDCAKEGEEYYRRVFDAVGVGAAEVIIVDDYPPAIGWAVATGAKVIQAKLSPVRHEETQPGVVAVVTDLNALPDLIAEVASRD